MEKPCTKEILAQIISYISLVMITSTSGVYLIDKENISYGRKVVLTYPTSQPVREAAKKSFFCGLLKKSFFFILFSI